MAAASNTVDGRQYHDAAGVYLLPNDASEHDRLDGQSQSLVALMGGKPFHAPVTNPKKILDVGCGTGAMTYLLARMYPDAHVIGVDFSAVPDGRYSKLDNIEYVQADIFELMREGKDARFEKGSFDYVFERLLFLGMTGWERYLEDVKGMVREGGWLELQEPTVNCSKLDGTSLAENWFHYPLWREDANAVGIDPEIGLKLPGLFKKSGGLSDIHETVYKFPPASRPDRPELDGLGDKIYPMLSGVIRKTSSPRRSKEEMAKMEEDLRSVFAAGFEDGDGYLMNVVIGQKTSS
ncbi:hypothetical protein PRZ48_014945 [Zasmidium cellare]|uniref:S-adenosyl-L-methionine-dependent methyltransferase n=1 Tax=Zasmidium cellare TaxID=395010 RepID=A0ABR0DX77_ZASCE|nr:hypothetical protein PRZ48_014945 [Zasmidium cellare]